MRAKVTGKSAWQGTPDDGYLHIYVIGERWADASGNATVSRYSGRLNPGKTGFGDVFNPAADLYIPVQGPDDPAGPLARFEETLIYGAQVVKTEYLRRLISTDLNGLIFDYATLDPATLPVGFGDAPLTMRAAQQLLDDGTVLIEQVGAGLQSVQTAQARADEQLLLVQAQSLTAQNQLDVLQAVADLGFAYGAVNSAAATYETLNGWGVYAVAGATEQQLSSNNTTAAVQFTVGIENGDEIVTVSYDPEQVTATTDSEGTITLAGR